MSNRVLLGSLGGDFGLRVARPGYDVLSEVNPSFIGFDSRWIKTFDIYMQGRTTAVPQWDNRDMLGTYYYWEIELGYVPDENSLPLGIAVAQRSTSAKYETLVGRYQFSEWRNTSETKFTFQTGAEIGERLYDWMSYIILRPLD